MTCIRSRFISRLVVSFIVFCLVWLAHDGARVGADQPVVKPSEAVFITYQKEGAERGIFTRQLPEAEAAKLRLKIGAEDGKNLPAVSILSIAVTLATSHRHIVRSLLLLARSLPSGLKQMEFTSSLMCPCSLATS